MCMGCNQQRSATDSVRKEVGLGIPKTTVSEVLAQDLGMKHGVAKFIPWLLLPEQKEHHVAPANDLIQTATNEPDFLKKVTTGDESWVCGRDPERKAQSSQCKLPGSPGSCPKKLQQSCSKIKTMLTVFLDGNVLSFMSTPLQDKQLVEYYFNVLGWLRDAT